MTARGRLALPLGLVAYVAGWAFGAGALYPVAVGLLLAPALAWIWVRVLDRPVKLRRSAGSGEHVEGDDVDVKLELEHGGRVQPTAPTAIDRVDGLGSFEVVLRRRHGRLAGAYSATDVPRGRYSFAAGALVLEDPFGLARREVVLPGGGALLVLPRLVELDDLFSDTGAHAHDGRRLLLRRPSGFDLHSVREYERGESLRKVHWPTTARRGQLMVKELEDAPRDEAAVLLDAGEGIVAGEAPESSFEAQVRAAGSILRAYGLRGRRTVLVVNALEREARSVRGSDGDWRAALEVLAAVQPTGRTPLAALLAEDASPAARALELTVVTAELPPALVDRLIKRALGRRSTSLVYVEASSWGRPREPRREPGLLRVQAAGVPVAVVRRGDDLRVALSAARASAHQRGGTHGSPTSPLLREQTRLRTGWLRRASPAPPEHSRPAR